MDNYFAIIFYSLLYCSIISFGYIVIRIICNRKFFKEDLFIIFAIMVAFHLIQNCSFLIYFFYYYSPQESFSSLTINFQVFLFILTFTCY